VGKATGGNDNQRLVGQDILSGSADAVTQIRPFPGREYEDHRSRRVYTRFYFQQFA
jgi:hypothetical protein